MPQDTITWALFTTFKNNTIKQWQCLNKPLVLMKNAVKLTIIGLSHIWRRNILSFEVHSKTTARAENVGNRGSNELITTTQNCLGQILLFER